MAVSDSSDVDRLLEMLRRTMLGLIQKGERNLTARQLAVFLICYYESEPQTVRGLADKLEVERPSITRAFDRLEGAELLRRRPDPHDRRSVLSVRTAGGDAFHQDLTRIVADAARAAENMVAPVKASE